MATDIKPHSGDVVYVTVSDRCPINVDTEVSQSIVSRFGLVVSGRTDLGSIPLRFSFLFKGCGPWALSVLQFVPNVST